MSKKEKNYEIVQPTFQLRVEKNVQVEPQRNRENIIYTYPLENKIELKINPVYIEEETIGLGNSPIVLKREITNTSDLKNKQKNKERNIKIQQHLLKSDANPKERIDYINKQRENLLKLNQNTNNELEIGGKESKYKRQYYNKSNEEILDLFYPSMSNKKNKDVIKESMHNNVTSKNSYSLEKNIPEISNVEKLFYKNGTFGEKLPNKLYDLTKYKKEEKDYEEIANVMYPTMSDNPKINELREKAREEEYQREKELKQKVWQYRIGAAVAIAAGAIPISRGVILTTTLAKMAVSYLMPILGKKISETLVQVVVESFLIGGISGLGEGVLNDENPIKTAITGTLMGTLFGIGIGLGVGVIGKNFAISEIERISNRDELLKKYFAEYIEGITIRTKEIVEYRRLKSGVGKNSIMEVVYDRIGEQKNYKAIWLSKEEYANLMSKLNTDLSKEERNKRIISKCVGNYKYKIINNGFDNYIVVRRKEI